jgi:cell division protein FtsZ
MVSTPFNVERARTVKAEEGLEKLRNEADSIIVLDNNRLLDYVPNLPIGKAFSVMDQIIAETVKGISETITQPSLINLDYADMSTIMDQGGVAVMLVGETQDKNKTEEVVNDAMNHPLLDVDYRGASGGLVHITGGPDLTLKQAQGIAESITERLEARANVIWGARIQDEYKGKVRVMAIMTAPRRPPSSATPARPPPAAPGSPTAAHSRARNRTVSTSSADTEYRSYLPVIANPVSGDVLPARIDSSSRHVRQISRVVCDPHSAHSRSSGDDSPRYRLAAIDATSS